ncbi:hypothetical protein H3C66_04840 [Patescibacteria group bacterium]|nr:hypothetical protein [Patescibacteria group bacterium]
MKKMYQIKHQQNHLISKLFASVVFLLLFLIQASPVSARENSVYGIHLMNTGELDKAVELLNPTPNDEWNYVTVPLTLDDLKKEDEWKNFFAKAKEKKVIPIVRLMTRFDNGAWQVPSKKNVVDLFTFLDRFDWPTDQRYVIVFNEVNHAKEWGGKIDPQSYTDALSFTADWAHSEAKNYKVLPAAMDLAAPNGSSTKEAFSYLNEMLAYNPQIFDKVDYWNSHSYPNPAFSSSPTKTGQNSMRGFTHELAFLKTKTNKDFQTFVTETGWEENASTRRWLSSYYQYTSDNIWSDERVIAVTPFVLQGDPGPFSGFSFLDKEGKPTNQYRAYQSVIKQSLDKILAAKQ